MEKSIVKHPSFNIEVQPAPSARDFYAEKFSVEIAAPVKGVKSPSLKVQLLAAGVSEDDYKAASKELSLARDTYRAESKQVVALLAADPRVRVAARQSFNKKGERIGATATFRMERNKAATKDSELAALRAEVAKLRGLVVATA